MTADPRAWLTERPDEHDWLNARSEVLEKIHHCYNDFHGFNNAVSMVATILPALRAAVAEYLRRMG